MVVLLESLVWILGQQQDQQDQQDLRLECNLSWQPHEPKFGLLFDIFIMQDGEITTAMSTQKKSLVLVKILMDPIMDTTCIFNSCLLSISCFCSN